MKFVALFFAGALLCNAIPHTIRGLCGLPFPSPFAKPPGKGDSSPLVNFLCGFFNFVAGLTLLAHFALHFPIHWTFAVPLLGALAIGIQLSIYFGQVQQAKRSQLP